MSTTVSAPTTQGDLLERVGYLMLLASVASLQLSIAAAHIFLAGTLVAWVALMVRDRTASLKPWRKRAGALAKAVEAPAMFWPLAAYAAVTLVSAVFSLDPLASIIDSRQLLLFLTVPAVYRLARGRRSITVVDVVITVGAASAAIGIVQYGILNYDHLGRRPQGVLSHYMTYSGLLMLVITATGARVLFRSADRTWAAVVMPALVVALALTFTRSAWIGAAAGGTVLLSLRDFRLLVVLPVLGVLFLLLAPSAITQRLFSIVDMNDPSNRDRFAMMRSGGRMIADDPLTGVGPEMVIRVYPQYRDPLAVEELNPHLHNVPLQIAAERGLPALAVWLWFIVALVRDLWRRFRSSAYPALAAGALAAVLSMLAAGFFEYNFGDSEFLMLFLVLVTLPFAVDRTADAHGR